MFGCWLAGCVGWLDGVFFRSVEAHPRTRNDKRDCAIDSNSFCRVERSRVFSVHSVGKQKVFRGDKTVAGGSLIDY